MNSVPVIWLTMKEETIARGYWDQGFIEGLFDGTVWNVPGAPDFEHYVVGGPNATHTWDQITETFWKPAIVVLPARHHAAMITEVNEALAQWSEIVLFLTGDEEHAFPVHELVHPRCQPWVMTPDPEKHATVERRFGTMWPPQLPKALHTDVAHQAAFDRPFEWFFAGQNTHERRQQCVDALNTFATTRPHPGITNPTPGFTQGLPPETYGEALASAKIAPCPSGPCSVDTFRLWEALEAGCIPLADSRTPSADGTEFWKFVLGDTPPFPVISGWPDVSYVIPELLEQWPANANRIFAWWQGHRRKMAYDLADDIQQYLGVEYRGKTYSGAEFSDLVTAIVPTSPIPNHPSIATIAQTIESIRERLGDCEIIIAFDGVRGEQEHLRAQYEEYQRRLLWHCLHVWHNVLPIRSDTHRHQASMTKLAMRHVRTPAVLFVEHDTPLVNDLPAGALLGALLGTPDVNMIRLHHETSVLEPHRHLMLDEVPQQIGPAAVPLLRTAQWSQRPHFARADFYERMLDVYFDDSSNTMIEDLIHGVVQSFWREGGLTGWSRFKLWMYAPDGNMQRSTHLDGRQQEPKFDMNFVYPAGQRPTFAP